MEQANKICRDCNSSSIRRCMAAAGAWGIMKAAAAEHSSARMRWLCSGHDPSACHLALSSQPPATADCHGALLHGNTWLLPRLLPKDQAPEGMHIAGTALPRHRLRHVAVVGGLGSLGSLAAAWLLQSGGCSCISLLGRSGRAPTNVASTVLHQAGRVSP